MKNVRTLKFGRAMGLGDTLWLTAIYKVCKNTSTYFFEDERVKRFSFIFDGLTDLHFDKDSESLNGLDFLQENYGVLSQENFLHWRNLDPTHVATKMFKILGVDESKYTVLPHINVSDECLALGQEILNKIGKVENPLVLVSNTSGGIFEGENSNNWRAAYRTLPPRAMQEVIDGLSKDFTILQCGKKGEVFEFNNTIRVYDLLPNYENPYKALAGLYKIVGKYVGLDTGDYNLMLATGGECKVLIPDKALWWNGVSSIFTKEEFKWERVRAEYINFRNYSQTSERTSLSF